VPLLIDGVFRLSPTRELLAKKWKNVLFVSLITIM
jgi:hypothetical protein